MLKIESREAANLKSRVKDLSQVPNLVNYAGLFACITPLSKVAVTDNIYKPILIRDTESLIANFGDPRIDPEKYVDLYSIMQIVGNGASCYVAKVNSGNTGIYPINLCGMQLLPNTWTADGANYTYNDGAQPSAAFKFSSEFTVTSVYESWTDQGTTHLQELTLAEGQNVGEGEYKSAYVASDGKYNLKITLHEALAQDHTIIVTLGTIDDTHEIKAYSSLTEPIVITANVSQAKPFSLGTYYLNVDVVREGNTLAAAKILLGDTLTNKGLSDSLTTSLSPYVQFELKDSDHAGACAINDDSANSIVKSVLDFCAPISQGKRKQLSAPVVINYAQGSAESNPSFRVTLDDYKNALMQYKDKKYTGCIMADFVAPLSHFYDNGGVETAANTPFGVPTPEERRSLHYYIKQIACERKDTNAILSVPLIDNDTGISSSAARYDGTDLLSLDSVCNWVASQGTYTDLWEYGQTNTTDYAEQSFYLEIYYTWLSMNCIKLENGIAKPVVVQVAPAGAVVNNVLQSYRERGPHLPVAGDNYGTLPSVYSVIVNPKTKVERDQLVQYRINPIYDTGTRGVQIYGNETLNAGYTDLNAAHIARSLVNLRSRIDEYTETLKFSLNNSVLWDTWKAYVSSNILEPAKSINAIKSYAVAMGYDTTTPEEIANRMVNGQVSLQFYQSAEIFDLTFTIFSTSAEELG